MSLPACPVSCFHPPLSSPPPPPQIALLGIQFQWTAETQAALSAAKTDKTIMSKNMKKVDLLLRDMIMLTLRTELTKIQRINLETCITVHMHQKESTEDLLKKKIKDPTDFEWLKQVGGRVSGRKVPALRVEGRGGGSGASCWPCSACGCVSELGHPASPLLPTTIFKLNLMSPLPFFLPGPLLLA